MNTYTSISEIAKHFAEIQPRTYTLTQAIAKISKTLPAGSEITAIQYEDGSKRKFNVQISGGKWQFIDLSNC